MVKLKKTSSFVCQECGYDSPSWLGKCPECAQWNSMKEIRHASAVATPGGFTSHNVSVIPQKLTDIVYKNTSRISTTFQEMNTVLGGGIVLGSVILLAGDPGVGKSTLLLQLCLAIAGTGKKVLYVTGEESSEQIKMRANRLVASPHKGDPSDDKKQVTRKSTTNNSESIQESEVPLSGTGRVGDKKNLQKSFENLLIVSLSDPDQAVVQIDTLKPELVIVDSIQTMQSENVAGLSGSIAQVRYSALTYVRTAKNLNIPTIIVGHVTKEGNVAGPMMLAHMVDTVLFLEGEKTSRMRILRSLKNRFGPVDEVGIFQMEEEGLSEVTNPEQIFLTKRGVAVPGSVLTCAMEGTRPFLVELQALAVYSKLPMPRRVVTGIDQRRVELLLAVLQKHIRLPVEQMDIFVNVAGGLKLSDPGVDLGVCLAIFSSLKNIAISDTVGIAEVGLLGELRDIGGSEKRVREAKKLGFKHVVTAKTHSTLAAVIASLGEEKKDEV